MAAWAGEQNRKACREQRRNWEGTGWIGKQGQLGKTTILAGGEWGTGDERERSQRGGEETCRKIPLKPGLQSCENRGGGGGATVRGGKRLVCELRRGKGEDLLEGSMLEDLGGGRRKGKKGGMSRERTYLLSSHSYFKAFLFHNA